MKELLQGSFALYKKLSFELLEKIETYSLFALTPTLIRQIPLVN